MRRLRSYILAVLFASLVGGAATVVVGPQQTVSAACGSDHVLTFPTWYRGVPQVCNGGTIDLKKTILTIALNVVEIIIQLVAYACVAFIIYGGFTYITGAGASDAIRSAKNTILNAIIGLVLSMLSVVVVNIIIGNLTKSSSTGTYGIPTTSAADIVSGILSTVYWLGGIVAVVVIIIAGIMYATSEGDSGKVQTAKNAILYSVIGLVVIMLAFAITHFVIGRIA